MVRKSFRIRSKTRTASAHVLVLLLIVATIGGTFAFQYKKDSSDDCSDWGQVECQTSPTLWFQCPITCSKSLEVEGSMAEIHDDPEAFFQLTVTKAEDGKTLSLENYEGYVTVFAVVPTAYTGMAKFYYDMLEHIAAVYPFTVQFIVLPWQSSKDDNTEEGGDIDDLFAPHRYTKPKVVLLEQVAASARPTHHPALEYLLNAKIVAGNGEDTELKDDRVTTFLVSSDGMFVERLVSPTITLLERRLGVYLLQLSMSPEL